MLAAFRRVFCRSGVLETEWSGASIAKSQDSVFGFGDITIDDRLQQPTPSFISEPDM
jgi:hypothetical protein